MTGFNDINVVVASEPALASLLDRGCQTPDSLNAEEVVQFNFLIRCYANQWWKLRRSLAEIRPFRTGMLGLGVGAILPVLQIATAASIGLGIPPTAIVFGLIVGGGLGIATSVGSLRLAQSAEQSAFERPESDPLAIPAHSSSV